MPSVTTIPRRRWLAAFVLLLAAAAMAAGAWLLWRRVAPVWVTLAAAAPGLPLEFEIIPSVVIARPGELISVTYRVRNLEQLPVAAFGRLEFDPPQAAAQVQVFLTQCGGLNTFQHGQVTDLDVFFRVQPAGLAGDSALTLRHTFERATPR
jgi:cytochrome c oxidase assembly protein Cox11